MHTHTLEKQCTHNNHPARKQLIFYETQGYIHSDFKFNKIFNIKVYYYINHQHQTYFGYKITNSINSTELKKRTSVSGTLPKHKILKIKSMSSNLFINGVNMNLELLFIIKCILTFLKLLVLKNGKT